MKITHRKLTMEGVVNKNLNSLSQDVTKHFEQLKEIAKQDLITNWKKLDEKILKTRNKNVWKYKDIRVRTIWTKLGIIKYRRRRYLNLKTNKYAFLLDQKLGIPKRLFVLPEDRLCAIQNFHKFRSYREIANSVFNSEVSPMAIHAFIKEQNTCLCFKGDFETCDGILWINADGLHLKLNRTKKAVEIKNFCFFSGREKTSSKKYKLQNRNVVSFINTNLEEITRVLKDVIGKYQNVQEIRIIGDGARWIKKIAYELEANFYIDKFHIRKTLNDVFKDHNSNQKALALISDQRLRTFELKEKLFQLVANPETGEVDKAKARRIGYIVNNSEPYRNSCRDKSVGVIEAIHAHFVARFFKHQRRGFSLPVLQNLITELNNWFNWKRYQQPRIIYV